MTASPSYPDLAVDVHNGGVCSASYDVKYNGATIKAGVPEHIALRADVPHSSEVHPEGRDSCRFLLIDAGWLAIPE